MKIDEAVIYLDKDCSKEETLCLMINAEQTNYPKLAYDNALKKFEDKYQEK